MKVLIICSAKPAFVWEKSYDSLGFDQAVQQAASCEAEAFEAKSIQSDGRRVYVSRHKCAIQTAELLLKGTEPVVEPLLDEIPMRAYKDSQHPLPLKRWRQMAKLQQTMGNERQPESTAQAKDRAEQLIRLLEEREEDCVLVSHPAFLKVLLDRFRIHGYCAARSGLFAIAPLERIVMTRREDHCGGCSHNCLLSNPGCGVGRDKARRRSN